MESLLTNLVFWHWFALAVVLIILDVASGANFFLIWCGLAAFVVGMLKLAIPTMTWEYQLLVFGMGVLASLIIWRKYIKGKAAQSDKPFLNRRLEQYVGQAFTLQQAIVDGHGKIKIGDTMWRVEGADCQAGIKVKIMAVEGTAFKVEPLE